MKTLEDVQQWIRRAQLEYADPSMPVGQLFVDFAATEGLRVEWRAVQSELVLTIGKLIIPLVINNRGAVVEADQNATVAFGPERIQDGLWTLNPSLNFPGVIHVFIVLYNVPEPAPWERRVWLPGDGTN